MKINIVLKVISARDSIMPNLIIYAKA